MRIEMLQKIAEYFKANEMVVHAIYKVPDNPTAHNNFIVLAHNELEYIVTWAKIENDHVCRFWGNYLPNRREAIACFAKKVLRNG